MGIFKKDSGKIELDEKELNDVDEELMQKLVFVPDDLFFFKNYTLKDTAEFYANIYKTFDKERAFKLAETLKLPINKKVSSFSKGMKRQVFVSLAFAIRPKYMLLDEAFDGLDPLARVEFKNQIKDMVEKMGSTVIISSHSLKELEDLCDAFAILNNTKIQASGSIEEAIGVLHKYFSCY